MAHPPFRPMGARWHWAGLPLLVFTLAMPTAWGAPSSKSGQPDNGVRAAPDQLLPGLYRIQSVTKMEGRADMKDEWKHCVWPTHLVQIPPELERMMKPCERDQWIPEGSGGTHITHCSGVVQQTQWRQVNKDTWDLTNKSTMRAINSPAELRASLEQLAHWAQLMPPEERAGMGLSPQEIDTAVRDLEKLHAEMERDLAEQRRRATPEEAAQMKLDAAQAAQAMPGLRSESRERWTRIASTCPKEERPRQPMLPRR